MSKYKSQNITITYFFEEAHVDEKAIEEEINKPIQAMNSGKKPKDEVHPVLIICPTISRDMNSTIDQLINEMNMHPANQRGLICVVANIDNDNQSIMDISKLTGAELFKKYIDK